MNWICAKAEFGEAPEDWSAVHEIFAAHGCGGTVEHPEPPGMSAYYYDGERSSEIITSLKKRLMDIGATTVSFDVVPDENWEESWRSFFKPRRIGKRFVVTPSWKTKPLRDTRKDDLVITLDPGQAFGTGDHATTRLCLSMLEEEIDVGDIVADLGCGAGILSIGAVLLGASAVYATEVDPPAVASARDNFKRNGVPVNLFETNTAPEGIPLCDVVVSNIDSAVLIRLSSDVARIVRPGGVWIISGVIPDNWDEVLTAAERSGFIFVYKREEEGWVAAAFRRSENR